MHINNQLINSITNHSLEKQIFGRKKLRKKRWYFFNSRSDLELDPDPYQMKRIRHTGSLLTLHGEAARLAGGVAPERTTNNFAILFFLLFID